MTKGERDLAGTAARTKRPDWYSESLARGLLVLRAFDSETPRLRISDIARRTGLTRAAARRYLLTLCELGYVGSDAELFFLRPRVLDLGYGFLSSARIERLVEPVLEEIAEETKAAAHLAVLDEDEVLFVAGIPSKQMLLVNFGIGRRMPAYAGSLGQVLLAALPGDELDDYLSRVPRQSHTAQTVVNEEEIRARLTEVAQKGFAVNRGEYIEGIVSVAIPVRDRSGDIFAALNVNRYSPQPLEQEEVTRYVSVMQSAREPIENALQAHPISRWRRSLRTT